MNNIKETILIVDDSRFQRAVIKETFHESFNFIEAASGEECMQLIESDAAHIDLVLLDLVMPGIDGFEVLKKRQENQKFFDIPVIVLTTSNSSKIQANAYELGANDFLIKPIDENTALFRIQNLLKSRKRIQTLVNEYAAFRVRAEIDDMTGFFNKRAAINLINNIINSHRDEYHALLAIDIDNFKAINDVYGHTVGDHTISIVAGAIATQFSETDITGRIGGDEFIVFVSNVKSKNDVYEKAQNIVDIISEKKNLSIPENVTISVGLMFTDGSENIYEDLFAKADEALYESKHAGKSCYSEYGMAAGENNISRIIAVMTNSRNVVSMMKFSHEASVTISDTTTFEGLEQIVSANKKDIPCIYIDISDMQDDGADVLKQLSASKICRNIPVVVLCMEGNMKQVRLAVSYKFVHDIIFAPIEPAQLKRRITAYMKNNN